MIGDDVVHEAGRNALDAEALGEGYERLLLVRRFEEAIQRLFLRGEIHGTVHLYNGQESVSVGVCTALRSGDFVSATYRGHGAALAMGTEPQEPAAELMGLGPGSRRQSRIDERRRSPARPARMLRDRWGQHRLALGAALSAKRTGAVSVAFFGDGAVNQGYFHECLNFAQVLSLPLLLVCENNLYGEFTAMSQVTAGGTSLLALGRTRRALRRSTATISRLCSQLHPRRSHACELARGPS